VGGVDAEWKSQSRDGQADGLYPGAESRESADIATTMELCF
jgi:hypothetical protein